MPDAFPFQVVWSAKVRNILRKMSRLATLPLRQRLAEILRDLDVRLSEDPLSVGEVYRTSDGIDEHLAVQGFLSINFAIDTERRLVLVRDCQALSGHGLD